MGKDVRTSLINKNIFFSFLIKGWSGLVQLLIVPVTIFCLGNYENGIWMTISSILLWIDSLDIGLGNGLRNTLASQLANGDIKRARESVSSTFFMLIFIITPVALLLVAAILLTDTYGLLNVDNGIVDTLDEVLIASVVFVCMTFIFKFVGNVYLGLQLPAVNNALVVLGQTVALIWTYILYLNGVHSLLHVAVAYTLSPLLVYLVSYPITFIFLHPELRPSVKYFKRSALSNLFSLGMKFFVLQIAAVILFATSNTLISRFFTPELVTPYQVAYRYFSFAMMFFSIIAIPYWSATTDAYAAGDMEWIKRSMKKIHRLVALLGVLLIVMVLISGFIYPLWVGENVHVPFSLSIGVAIYMFIIMFSMSYSLILNGIGALNMQLIFTVIAALLFIPVAWLFSKWMGLTGIIAALCVVNTPGAIVNMVQFNKLMRGTAKGLWRN